MGKLKSMALIDLGLVILVTVLGATIEHFWSLYWHFVVLGFLCVTIALYLPEMLNYALSGMPRTLSSFDKRLKDLEANRSGTSVDVNVNLGDSKKEVNVIEQPREENIQNVEVLPPRTPGLSPKQIVEMCKGLMDIEVDKKLAPLKESLMTVEITVRDVSQTPMGSISVSGRNSERISIYCWFSKDQKEEVARLRKGDRVSISGGLRALVSEDAIALERCSINP